MGGGGVKVQLIKMQCCRTMVKMPKDVVYFFALQSHNKL